MDHIRKKGPVDNASTDLGEALHPQTKVDWSKGNHQPDTAEDQVLFSFADGPEYYTKTAF